MYQKAFIFILLLFLVGSIYNQIFGHTTMDSTGISKNKTNNVYLEYNTQGFLYSLNYDRVRQFKNFSLSYRIGISYIQHSFQREQYYMVIPTLFNILLGKKLNKIETGFGLIFYNIYNNSYITDKLENIIFGFINIGYRRQSFKGIMYRFAYCPIIYLYPDYQIERWNYKSNIPIHLLGFSLSIGYAFSRKSKNIY